MSANLLSHLVTQYLIAETTKSLKGRLSNLRGEIQKTGLLKPESCNEID
jgi:hypothetical protein